jgi:CheY-like chemotaxis protein
MNNDFSTWRVLAADDEPDNLELLTEVLNMQGATVHQARDGQAVLDAIDAFRPNVILLDLAMPGMDGWEAHRRLRGRGDLDQVPIIAITALAMAQDREQAVRDGFDGFITKPYRIQALLTELDACVRPFLSANNRSG